MKDYKIFLGGGTVFYPTRPTRDRMLLLYCPETEVNFINLVPEDYRYAILPI